MSWGTVFNVLDVGCGFLDNERLHKRREGIGIDIHSGKADVLASAEYLPFKENIFKVIHVRNLLEHLKEPMRCLSDVSRVAKDSCEITITIPIIANIFYQELISMFTEFPFGLFLTIRRLIRTVQYRDTPGWIHLNKIQPRHIDRILEIKNVRKVLQRHAWASGRKGKILSKVGIKTYISGPRKDYFVFATKRV